MMVRIRTIHLNLVGSLLIFADQMVIDFDELDSSINPIDNPERFLVYAMDFNMRNLLRNLDLSEVESVEELKSVLEESDLDVEY